MYNQTDPNALYPTKGQTYASPFGKFVPDTYNQQFGNVTHGFNKAYRQNKQFIEKINFQNRGEILHNNLGNNLLEETITEYTVDIDSYDRDTSVYFDPFSYTVMFAPVVNSGVSRHEEYIDPSNKSLGMKIVEDIFSGPPQPYIARSFKNVKYVRVDSACFPKYSDIVYDTGSSSWIMDTSKNLSFDRNVTMKIKNLDSSRILSTKPLFERNTIKLIPDTVVPNGNYYTAISANDSNVIKIFNDTALGNIDRLQISFYDSFGNQLKYSNLDSTQPITDVRNPKNKYLQHTITLVFGVIENELATEPKYGPQ